MGKALKDRKLKFETLQLHVGQEEADPVTGARAVPIYQTIFLCIYATVSTRRRVSDWPMREISTDRLTNPTRGCLRAENRSLGGRCGSAGRRIRCGGDRLYTSESGAVLATTSWLQTTSTAAPTIYWHILFPQYGITTTFVDPFDYDEVEQAIQENTRGDPH